jgi:hypothetical protein
VHAGEVLGSALAHESRDDLRDAGKGDGRCAFTFHSPRRLPASAARSLIVRRAHDGVALALSDGLAPHRAAA